VPSGIDTGEVELTSIEFRLPIIALDAWLAEAT
jgi:hypothetical protein